jgi:polar amino acid transport system permease protein
MNYDWNFQRLSPYTHAFVSGIWVTVSLTFLVILIGTVIGFFIGFFLKRDLIKFIFFPFIDVIRALPPLVLILFMYYLLSEQVIGSVIQAYWICVIAMSLNLIAFVADLVRSSLENVPKGLIDAGKILGLSPYMITRHIVFPYIIREIMPGLFILYLGILKMSSLAAIINVNDVVYTAQTIISNNSRSLEAWTVVAVIYIILVLPATYFFRYLEKRIKITLSY